MSDFGRWLDPISTAAYIGERVDHLPRLLKAGKLPAPSYHLGPRKPRYDRLAIDAMFSGTEAANDDQAIVNALIERARRQKEARGRHHQRIPLRPQANAKP